MSELPKGWKIIELKHLGEYINGRAFKPSEWDRKGLPIIRIQNLTGSSDHYNYSDQLYEDKFRIKNGELLVAWSASLGAFIWKGSDAWLNQHIFKVIPNEHLVTKEFLYYTISNAIEELYDKTHGTGMVHVTKPVFESHKVFLPSLIEQKRIVEKLDKLLAKVGESKARLEKIPGILKRLRQSVLFAAYTGLLTQGWRRKNLVNIEDQNYLAPERIPFSIPESWCWVKWIDVVSQAKHSFKRGPFGGALKKEIFVTTGYKVYEQCNPINDNCDLGNYFITKEKFEELNSFKVNEGDLLISCSGVTLGRITRIPHSYKEGIINQALLKVTLDESKINSDYFISYFRSKTFQEFLFENAQGSAQPNIKGVKELKTLPIPLAPLQEQIEIVKRINTLFKKADEIEMRYNKAKCHIDKITQSILSRAFRGELVPQEV